MAYKKYNGSGNLQYGGYSNNTQGRYSNQGGQGYGPRPFVKKKHSGCKAKKDYTSPSGKKHALVVYGWKFTKQFGMCNFVATVSKHQGGKDNNYTNMVVKFTSPISQSTLWGQWNISKQELWIPDLNITASPSKDYVAYIMPKSFKR